MSYIPLTMLPRSKWAQENIAKGREEGLAEGREVGRAEGEAVGRAEGEAVGITESVLRFLDYRGIRMTSAIRARISSCTDVAMAKTWLDEALSIEDVNQLSGFDGV
jgi:predicted transposase YdaD